MKRLPLVMIVLAAVYAILLLIPVDRANPPPTAPLAAPAGVAAVLERACYDCHSNETRWPWYGYLPPASWLVAHDVKEGREHLNFSAWGSYTPKEQAKLMHEVVEEVEAGAMPMPMYVRLHPAARLTPDDVQALRAWAQGGADPGAPPAGKTESDTEAPEED